ncbi:MAG: hypothetical protein ACTHU0_36825 [Kofleriaceae bacterium]
MAISPCCPCRISHQTSGALMFARLTPIDDERAVWAATAMIAPGKRPAAGAPQQLPSSDRLQTWRFADDGPEIVLIAASGVQQFEDAFEQLDTGVGAGPWRLVGPGCFLGFPSGFTLMSPVYDNDPLFELQLNDGATPVVDAIMQFEGRRVAAGEVQLRGQSNVEQGTIQIDAGTVRTWEYGYEFEGVSWRKRHYALPLAADLTILMTAQAPVVHYEAMFDGAEAVVAGFAPLE